MRPVSPNLSPLAGPGALARRVVGPGFRMRALAAFAAVADAVAIGSIAITTLPPTIVSG